MNRNIDVEYTLESILKITVKRFCVTSLPLSLQYCCIHDRRGEITYSILFVFWPASILEGLLGPYEVLGIKPWSATGDTSAAILLYYHSETYIKFFQKNIISLLSN